MLIFRFTPSLILKEIRSLDIVIILKDINKERICRTNGHLTEKSLDGQLTDNDLKKFKQNIETEICSYSPTSFLHRHQYIVQTPCEKEFGGKEIKDGTMITISFSQYEWTDVMTVIPNKIIINNILIPFIVSSNTHITDVSIKEALIDSPLLIIKENNNCGNFLNKDRFNFLTYRVNHKSLTDFSQTITLVDERLYGEALFHIFSQNEIYSNTYKTNRIITDFVKFLNSCPSNIERLHHDYSYTTTQRGHKCVQRKVCFIICTLNFKNDFLIKHFKEISQKYIGERILKMNLKEALHENVYFQNNISRNNLFPKTQLQTTINKKPSKTDMKGKGKASTVQPKEI